MRHRKLRLFALAALALLIAAPAQAQTRQLNGLLTNLDGLTLYTFDNDATVPGKSACAGACLSMWTPLYAKDADKTAGDYGFVTRDDGRRQWTYKGKPLYTWYNDKKPGDTDSDGLRQAWHVARP